MSARRIKLGPGLALIALLMMAWSAPAMAQIEGEATAQQADEEEEEVTGLPEVDEDHPLYWAQMREIYTMQHRAFIKEGRFAATLYAGLIPNSIFEQYFPVGLRINYYMMENIGLELSSSYAFQRNTTVNEIVTDETGISAAGDVLVGDTQVSHTTVGVKWSPVYGKFTYGDSRLFYFDMYVFGGAGLLVAQTQTTHGDPSEDPDIQDTDPKAEGVLGAGAAFYMGEHLGLRVDYRQFIFQKVNGGVANPSEISLGLTWFF